MRKTACVVMAVLGLLAFGPSARANEIDWAVTAYTWNDHTNMPMHAGADAATGWLVQLIYAGLNGFINPATNVAYGVSGDDEVVISGFFDSEMAPGKFAGTYANSYANGSKFFFRAWEGVTSGGGLIPQPAPSSYGGQSGWWYGESGTTLFTVIGNKSPPDIDTFESTADLGGSSGATAMQFLAIPEPGMAGFMVLGVGALMLRRLRQKLMT